MERIELASDFKDFLKLLNSNGVEYLLVGGYAVSYHGYPRSTAGMDIWIAISPENARRVADVLVQFGFSSGVSPDIFMVPNRIARMGVPPMRIELLNTISGVAFADAYSRRVAAVIDGTPVNVISLDDLNANKQAAGRAKDLADLEGLPKQTGQ